MSMTDPDRRLSDPHSQRHPGAPRRGAGARRPSSRCGIAELLKDEGYIAGYDVRDDGRRLRRARGAPALGRPAHQRHHRPAPALASRAADVRAPRTRSPRSARAWASPSCRRPGSHDRPRRPQGRRRRRAALRGLVRSCHVTHRTKAAAAAQGGDAHPEGGHGRRQGAQGRAVEAAARGHHASRSRATSCTVVRADDSRENRAKHGLMRAHLANMVKGVTDGWTRELEINGVGYRAEVAGDTSPWRSATRTRWCSSCRRA